MLGISGSIKVKQYKDKDGNKKESTDVLVDEFYFLSNNKSENKNVLNITNKTITKEKENALKIDLNDSKKIAGDVKELDIKQKIILIKKLKSEVKKSKNSFRSTNGRKKNIH